MVKGYPLYILTLEPYAIRKSDWKVFFVILGTHLKHRIKHAKIIILHLLGEGGHFKP